MRKLIIGLVLAVAIGVAVVPYVRSGGTADQAQKFIDEYTGTFKILQYDQALAEWASNTHIVEGDTMNAFHTREASELYASFTGSRENIASAQKLLEHRDELDPVTVKQLDAILYAAADNPQTVPELVRDRIAAQTKQVENLYGYDFKIDGRSVSTNEIDDILKKENNLTERLAAWEASKKVGIGLKDGLVDLQRLRNETVQALGYDDYFQYQVSDYGMTTKEMMDLLDKVNHELRPLYRELHTYVRYMLAERYGEPVPDQIPAHWLPNRWGQDWSTLVTVEGLDLDSKLATKPPQWFVEQAERFYVSLGFKPLPQSFYLLSSLYPAPPGANYKKNNHASAWHMDLQNDLRSLMSIVPNAEWYETTHHELGHIYYYQCYTNPQVPLLLRSGANRAYHEAIGSMMGLAAMQKPFLEHIGLFPEGQKTDEIQSLLKESMNYIVFMPWSAGVMSHFEEELYEKPLAKEDFNKRWWELKLKYQGIVPPNERTGDLCDPASKTHINNDAAQYYDYALSYVLLFQIHDHIATKILKESPRSTDYYGNKEVGKFLISILSPGATRDWRELTREAVGSDISAEAMLRYFEPLMAWLKEQNKGRKYTLPDA